MAFVTVQHRHQEHTSEGRYAGHPELNGYVSYNNHTTPGEHTTGPCLWGWQRWWCWKCIKYY
jgi:hypothetical protein